VFSLWVQIDPKGWFTLAKFVGETIRSISLQWGEISCQLVPACSRMSPRNVFQHLWSEKSQNYKKTSTTVKAREKNEPRFGVLRNLLMYVWINLKTIKSYLIKLATEFYWQPSCLLGERSSLYLVYLPWSKYTNRNGTICVASPKMAKASTWLSRVYCH
jgi:hypothetical protein